MVFNINSSTIYKYVFVKDLRFHKELKKQVLLNIFTLILSTRPNSGTQLSSALRKLTKFKYCYQFYIIYYYLLLDREYLMDIIEIVITHDQFDENTDE